MLIVGLTTIVIRKMKSIVLLFCLLSIGGHLVKGNEIRNPFDILPVDVEAESDEEQWEVLQTPGPSDGDFFVLTQKPSNPFDILPVDVEAESEEEPSEALQMLINDGQDVPDEEDSTEGLEVTEQPTTLGPILDTPKPTLPSLPFNQRLDEIIKTTIDKNRAIIEPLKVSSIRNGFSRKLPLVTIRGESLLSEIAIGGLSTLHRSDNSSLVKTKYGNGELQLTLSLGPLNFRAVHTITFIGLSSKTELLGRIDKVKAQAIVHYHTPTNELYLKSFEVQELGQLTANIKGPKLLGLFNRINSALLNRAIRTLKPLVRRTLETRIRLLLAANIMNNEFLINSIKQQLN